MSTPIPPPPPPPPQPPSSQSQLPVDIPPPPPLPTTRADADIPPPPPPPLLPEEPTEGGGGGDYIPPPPPPPAVPPTAAAATPTSPATADRKQSISGGLFSVPGTTPLSFSMRPCNNFKSQTKLLLKSSKKMITCLKDFNDSLKGFTNALLSFLPLLTKDPEDSQSINVLTTFLKSLSVGYDKLSSDITSSFEKSLESFYDYFFNDLFELEKRKEKLRIESNYPNRKNMEKIKADYVSANKAFEAKYVEVTEQMDPTFMGSVLTLANAFVGMKEKYEKLSYLEERVAVLERRVESSKPATTNVVKEGYLNMKTTFSWQREYFVIKEGKLFHLNAGKVATPYVITSARLYNQKASGMKLSDAERCVEVTCDRKKNSIVLQAQSKRERDAWLTELLSVVVSAPPPPQPSPSTPSQSQSSQSPQPSQSQSQAGGDSGDSEGGVKLGLLKLKTRLAGAGSVSNSGRRPRSGSPDSTAVMVSWEELKGSELRQPVSYSRRASGGKGEARSVRIAGVPPWALSLVAKSAGSNSSSGAERLPFFPPLTLGCFYRDHAYTESKGSTTPQVDRPDEALSITSFENDGSELSFHEDASDASSSAFSAVSPAPSGDLQQHKSTQMPAENTSNEPASRAPPGSQQMDSEFSSGIATAAGGGDGSSSSSSSTSTNTNSNSNSSNNSTNNSNSNNNNTSVSATTPSQTSQQYYATTIQYSNRKHTAISRRKKFPVEEEAPESNDGIAIDTDKVTEGITFAELVQRLAKTNQMITVISTESQKMCDLAKLNIAMQALHNVKCSLAFMTDEPFVPAASVDDARAQISGAVSELRDTIKEIATSLKLVVPDNSSSWAFYVQPIDDAYTSILKFKP